MSTTAELEQIARLLRYYSLLETTSAGSGHPSSCLSAADLMATLCFGGFFHFDPDDIDNPQNDRLIFSKGHAAPLLYAIYAVAGKVSVDELKRLRKFDSPLEGHPTPHFPYAEAATGSLGQGLSIGLGMALHAKKILPTESKIFVLLGDSELAEGQVWEALQLAAHYQLNNLYAIVDVNRLGQRGETMQGHDLHNYAYKARAFGWQTAIVNGHNLEEIQTVFGHSISNHHDKPTMILARTLKGKGVSLMEGKNGWHGKALSEEEFTQAKKELGTIGSNLHASFASLSPNRRETFDPTSVRQEKRGGVGAKKTAKSTRDAYGQALVSLGAKDNHIVVLDAEVSNSTRAADFATVFPERFFEMFIAEQNMISTAVGLSQRGSKPFVSSFAAFLTRSFDQIRMAAYSQANLVIVGSHAGVEIGADGSSQMGLEDIAMMRSVEGSLVLYPSDATSTTAIMNTLVDESGIKYLRTTRGEGPDIYDKSETFPIGGSKVLHKSENDRVSVVAAGVTLHEALKAYEILKKDGVTLRIIDLYSIKPVDGDTLRQAASETGQLITVEDHHPEGGIAEAVLHALSGTPVPVHSLAVRKTPHSGTKDELLAYEEIDATAIIKKVKEIL